MNEWIDDLVVCIGRKDGLDGWMDRRLYVWMDELNGFIYGVDECIDG